MSPASLTSEVARALNAAKLSLPKRRVIAALVVMEGCSVEEATESLEAAVQEHVEQYGRCQWGMLTSWVTVASIQLYLLRRRRSCGTVVELFPGGAP